MCTCSIPAKTASFRSPRGWTQEALAEVLCRAENGAAHLTGYGGPCKIDAMTKFVTSSDVLE
jgi:hypothetical protein